MTERTKGRDAMGAAPEGVLAVPSEVRPHGLVAIDLVAWGPASPVCLLVAEPTPLLLLALVGTHALDLLLVPGAEVRIADLAADGLPPGWLADHAGRVALQRTRTPSEPCRTGVDPRAVAEAVVSASSGGRGVFAIADDGGSRSAISARDLPGVRLMSTRGFLRWIGSAFGVASASLACRDLAAVSGLSRA